MTFTKTHLKNRKINKYAFQSLGHKKQGRKFNLEHEEFITVFDTFHSNIHMQILQQSTQDKKQSLFDFKPLSRNNV